MTKQEFMAISLPYKLICKEVDLNEEFYLTPKLYSLIELLNWSSVYQPILRPLSDLDSYNLNSPMNLSSTLALCHPYSLKSIVENRIATNTLLIIDALELIRHHFDIASLIPKGEAIDINTLEINVYK